MIAAQFYQIIYLIVVAIITIIVTSRYSSVGNNAKNNSVLSAFFLAVIMSLFIGFRPLSGYYFVDMANYNAHYEVIKGDAFSFNWDTDNYIFDNIFLMMASLKLPIEFFFFLVALIYFVCAFYACKKIFPNDTLIAFLVFLGAFSTFSYATNGIKAGAAASVFLLALAYREKKVLSILFLFLSLGFHHSMLAPIVAYVMATVYRKPKWYLYAWIVCFLLAAAHITFFQTFFAGFTDEQGAGYLDVTRTDKDVTGFRPDFILYSAVPVFIGFYLMIKKRIKSDYYNFLWCVYTATNCVFLLCTYGSYINRIAYLSWLMYPIVLLYPFINISWSQYQKKYLKQAVYYHLGFTVFMVFIYYGLLSLSRS